MLCGHLAIFMSAGVSSAADCGSLVAAACALLVCWGMCDVVLMVVPARGGFLGGAFLRDGGCDRMSLAG